MINIQDKWELKTIEEIVDVNPRIDKSDISEDDDIVSFVPMAAVSAKNGQIDTSQERSYSVVKKGFTPFKEGDVLFAKITPCMENGKMAVVPKLISNHGFGSTEFHVLRPKNSVDSKYIYYFVSSAKFRNNAQHNMTGAVGQKRVPTNYLKNHQIPVPPPEQQKQIVAKIEELFSHIDAGVVALQKAKKLLKQYRQSVLKAAVTGELTREWREQNKEKLEPASELLKRILAERRSKWEEQQLEQFKAQGKMPKDDKWKSKYKEPLGLEFEHVPVIPSIPETWKWVNINQLTLFVKDGPHYSPKYVEQGIPFISGGSVRPHGVDFHNCKYITPELHEELSKRCKPELNDILYTKGGTTGIARVNTYKTEFNVWVHVAVIRLVDTNQIEPFYIQHALNSQLCYMQSQKYTHGVGNQDLGLTRMIKICFPLPPKEEQKKIIEVIDRQLDASTSLENQIDDLLQIGEKNKQSVLLSAFSGRLLKNSEIVGSFQ